MILILKTITITKGIDRTHTNTNCLFNRLASKSFRAAACYAAVLLLRTLRIPWSHVWCNRMQSSDDHMRCHPEFWPTRLSSEQYAQWLQMQRLASGSQSILPGITHTTAMRAKVETPSRFHIATASSKETTQRNGKVSAARGGGGGACGWGTSLSRWLPPLLLGDAPPRRLLSVMKCALPACTCLHQGDPT